jgi:hypothetical protein
MEPLHRRIAEVALRAAEPYGFCLAGGYAVQEHGLVQRRSEDVDLFTTAAAQADFGTAVDKVAAALAGDGLVVEVTRRADTFARLTVADPAAGSGANLDLGVDWRAHPPARLAIGPVLHMDDAVANKICALYSRAEVRDYVDVHGILTSGRYDPVDLLRISAEHDPGFDHPMFAEALRAVDRVPDVAFAVYDLSPPEAAALRTTLKGWADALAPR